MTDQDDLSSRLDASVFASREEAIRELISGTVLLAVRYGITIWALRRVSRASGVPALTIIAGSRLLSGAVGSGIWRLEQAKESAAKFGRVTETLKQSRRKSDHEKLAERLLSAR